jgi:flagellar biosynthesis/type III secretory pathway protein FliH
MTAPLNRDRFMKLIALAESNQDGEALSAIRKAASMARAAGMSLGEAVGSHADGPANTLTSFMTEYELTLARARIAELERKLCMGANEAQLDAAHSRGYVAGHKAGKAEGEREVTMAANQRIRDVEAQLEAYRPALDWLPVNRH